MKALIICVTLATFALFSSCGDDSPTSSSMKSYKYTGYDSTGQKVITGYLWIDSVDSSTVKGSWEFKLVGNCENLGPQIGKGNFDGVKNSNGNMSLNLNPGWIDNNVFLIGSFQNSYYGGDWNYVGFPGVINTGSFEAHRVP